MLVPHPVEAPSAENTRVPSVRRLFIEPDGMTKLPPVVGSNSNDAITLVEAGVPDGVHENQTMFPAATEIDESDSPLVFALLMVTESV